MGGSGTFYLTVARARFIKRYFIRQGIESHRLLARGYEGEKPLIKNAKTEEGHQKNRRVEFKILKKE